MGDRETVDFELPKVHVSVVDTRLFMLRMAIYTDQDQDEDQAERMLMLGDNTNRLPRSPSLKIRASRHRVR